MMGGRHRKGHKSRKTRKGRKMSGGVMYGPTQAITPGALQWGTVDASAPVDSATGRVVADPFKTSPDTNAKVTGGRRASRRSRKGKSKKSVRKTRKMRGGASVFNTGAVRAEFVGNPGGKGPFTYGTYVGSPSKVGAGPTPGPDGVMPLA